MPLQTSHLLIALTFSAPTGDKVQNRSRRILRVKAMFRLSTFSSQAARWGVFRDSIRLP